MKPNQALEPAFAPHGHDNHTLADTLSMEHEDISNRPSSIFPLTLHNSSAGSSLSDSMPRKTRSSEVTLLEDGLEPQFKAQPRPKNKERRRSLVNLASVLNESYEEDIDDCNDINP